MRSLQLVEKEMSELLESFVNVNEYSSEVDQDGRIWVYKTIMIGEEEFDTFIDRDVYNSYWEYMVELTYELEHRKKMLHLLTKAKTYVEVKSLQMSYILNYDVKTVIAGYLTGISNKPIEKQLQLL
jgi:hypothetical protein